MELRRLQHLHFWPGRRNVSTGVPFGLQISLTLLLFLLSFFTERSGAVWPTLILSALDRPYDPSGYDPGRAVCFTLVRRFGYRYFNTVLLVCLIGEVGLLSSA